MDKSRSKEKGGEPEMFLEDAGILIFFWRTDVLVSVGEAAAPALQQMELLTSPRC